MTFLMATILRHILHCLQETVVQAPFRAAELCCEANRKRILGRLLRRPIPRGSPPCLPARSAGYGGMGLLLRAYRLERNR